eukprot:scaffold35361_cov129-Isochrysis_galbana.AAC.3
MGRPSCAGPPRSRWAARAGANFAGTRASAAAGVDAGAAAVRARTTSTMKLRCAASSVESAEARASLMRASMAGNASAHSSTLWLSRNSRSDWCNPGGARAIHASTVMYAGGPSTPDPSCAEGPATAALPCSHASSTCSSASTPSTPAFGRLVDGLFLAGSSVGWGLDVASCLDSVTDIEDCAATVFAARASRTARCSVVRCSQPTT